jgi:hypothetical protein
VRNADVRNNDNVRLGQSRQGCNFARMIHADLPNGDFMVRSRFQDGSRKTNVIVKVPFCFCDPKTAGKNGRSEIFRTGFAVASSYRNDFERQGPPVVGGKLLIGLQSIFRANEREGVWKFSLPIGLHDRPSRTGFCDGFNEIVPVEIFAAQSNK